MFSRARSLLLASVVAAHTIGHCIDVGAPVRVDTDLVCQDAEVVRRLVERGVGALGDHHLGRGDAAFDAGALTGRFDREQDALGAARCHESGRFRRRVEQLGSRADHL